MFIFDKPMNHREINSYLDALARTRKDDNNGLARKAKKIVEESKKENAVKQEK